MEASRTSAQKADCRVLKYVAQGYMAIEQDLRIGNRVAVAVDIAGWIVEEDAGWWAVNSTLRAVRQISGLV